MIFFPNNVNANQRSYFYIIRLVIPVCYILVSYFAHKKSLAPENPAVSETYLSPLLFYHADWEKLLRLRYSYSYDGSRDIECRTWPDNDHYGLHRREIYGLKSLTCREGRTPPMTRLRITNRGSDAVNINAVKIYAAGKMETN